MKQPGFWKCHGEMFFVVVEQDFSSFFAKFLAYLYLMIFQSTVKLSKIIQYAKNLAKNEEFALNSFSADFWNPKIQFQVPDPILVIHRDLQLSMPKKELHVE